MPGADWLRESSRLDLVVPRRPRFVAADDFWEGTIDRVDVAPDLRVYLNDMHIRRDFKALTMADDLSERVIGHIAISGGSTIDLQDGIVADVDGHRAALFRRWDRTAVYGFEGGSHFLSVGYAVAPGKIEALLDGEVPDPLRRLLKPGSAAHDEVMTSAASRTIQTIAQRLFSNELNGPLQRLAMEGTVLQLVAAQVGASAVLSARRPALSAAERRAVTRARERLVADMRDPPSLAELAREVRLSEKRLNAGFRELFAQTVFEVLRNERLEHARRALEEQALPLKEIAFRVGYNHVSNFVHAFTARYGAPPARYLARQRSR